MAGAFVIEMQVLIWPFWRIEKLSVAGAEESRRRRRRRRRCTVQLGVGMVPSSTHQAPALGTL